MKDYTEGITNTEINVRMNFNDIPIVYLEDPVYNDQFSQVSKFCREVCAVMEDHHRPEATKTITRGYKHDHEKLRNLIRRTCPKPVQSAIVARKVYG